ncbi:MAG: hydroxypyruvate isomerase [Candidatus Lambdaproteobacteria bacterium]|nr:hydroxypyruvate isomerase [Candidatus Lambdaproteobacteria bacterium]
MPRFAANLTLMFNEVEFLGRFERAARAGFKGVEYLFPYAHPKEALAEQLRRHGLTQVLHNLPAGDWDKGERGIAVLPDRVGEFQAGVGTAIEYARALGCGQLNCLVGLRPPGIPEAKVWETLVANLRFAAGALEKAGIRLLVEPLNLQDIPGFYLVHTAEALRLFEAVGHPNLHLQYDIYHMQIMEGDLTQTIRRHLPRIAHMQLADVPGRHEPGSGEINYPNLFRFIDEAGYTGWIGCEYKPAAATEAGLGWLKPYLT